jgi:hypothetical protein
MFRRKKPEPEPVHLHLPQPVWFILVEVQVTGNSIQPWIAGSKALVQTFVPAVRIEDALTRLDGFLPTQELVRLDTLRATRHDENEEWDVPPDNYYREPLEEAARMGDCRLGVFVVSQDTAWPHSEKPS